MADPRLLLLAVLAACGHVASSDDVGSDAPDTTDTEPPDTVAATDVPSDTDPPPDVDGDGYAADVDCRDDDPSVHPGVTEIAADGVDQDCDGVQACLADLDGDGAAGLDPVPDAVGSCDGPPFVPADAPVDCDDQDPAAFPGAIELVGSGHDEDCDGVEICYLDEDGDHARTLETVARRRSTCTATGEALVEAPLDCDDQDPRVHPGSADTVGDGVDGNCDRFEACYVDADHDGARSQVTVLLLGGTCRDPGLALASARLDCDDLDPAVTPLAAEVVGDGLDADCDGWELCLVDRDRDGWAGYLPVRSTDFACVTWPTVAADTPVGDCDEGAMAIHPGAHDPPLDGVDQDCDGRDACTPGDTACPVPSCVALRGTPSGRAWMSLPSQTDAEVACEQDLDGGGWTLAAVVADDGQPGWAWTDGGWIRSYAIFGDLDTPDLDYRGEAFAWLGVRDLLFEHVPSGTWAAYHGVGDGTLALDAWVAGLPSSECAPARFALSAGTLTLAGDLCSTDLLVSPAGASGGSCDRNASAYGPAWSVGPGGTCPTFEPGVTGSLGADHAHPLTESDAVGFARAVGLVDAWGDAGAMRVYVR